MPTLAELSVKHYNVPATPLQQGNLFAGVLSVISKPGWSTYIYCLDF
jgi:hypothetical protein